MRFLITPARVRAAIAGAETEIDVTLALRRHRIRYTWTTAPGFLAARVPVRSGSVLIYRTGSEAAAFSVRSASPVHPGSMWPTLRLHNDD